MEVNITQPKVVRLAPGNATQLTFNVYLNITRYTDIVTRLRMTLNYGGGGETEIDISDCQVGSTCSKQAQITTDVSGFNTISLECPLVNVPSGQSLQSNYVLRVKSGQVTIDGQWILGEGLYLITGTVTIEYDQTADIEVYNCQNKIGTGQGYTLSIVALDASGNEIDSANVTIGLYPFRYNITPQTVSIEGNFL